MFRYLYSTVQYSTVRYGTVRYGTVRYGTVRYGTVQYSTVQYSTVQYSTVQYSTVQYSTVQVPVLVLVVRVGRVFMGGVDGLHGVPEDLVILPGEADVTVGVQPGHVRGKVRHGHGSPLPLRPGLFLPVRDAHWRSHPRGILQVVVGRLAVPPPHHEAEHGGDEEGEGRHGAHHHAGGQVGGAVLGGRQLLAPAGGAAAQGGQVDTLHGAVLPLVHQVTGGAPRAGRDLDAVSLPEGEVRVLLLQEEPLVVFAVCLHLVRLEARLALGPVVDEVVVDGLVVEARPLPLDVDLLGLVAGHVGDEGCGGLGRVGGLQDPENKLAKIIHI